MQKILILTLVIICVMPLLLASKTHAQTLETDKSKAVILAYHRIGEPQEPQSNIDIEQFTAHINDIINGGYTILPLSEIIDALNNKTPLPYKTIAITFEGGYRSAYENAIPLLIKHNLPFTFFFSSGSTEIPDHVNWSDIKKISHYKHASFGLLPDSYSHIAYIPKSEAARSINLARIAYKEHMHKEADFFAYPFGEISSDLKNIIKAQRFKAALGLQSGPAYSGSDILALPRFSMTGHYGTLERFQMITNTYPFPAKDITPQDNTVLSPINQIGFTTSPELENSLQNISCHISDQGKPDIETLGNRIEIIPHTPIIGDRARLNCTLPVTILNKDNEEEKSWRWFGLLFHSEGNNEDIQDNEE